MREESGDLLKVLDEDGSSLRYPVIDYGFLLLYRIACVTITSEVLEQSRFLLIMHIMSLSSRRRHLKYIELI